MRIDVLADAEGVAREIRGGHRGGSPAACRRRGRFLLRVSEGKRRDPAPCPGRRSGPWNMSIRAGDERVAPSGHPDRNLTHLARNPSRTRPAASLADPCDARGPPDLEGSRELCPTLRGKSPERAVLDLALLGWGRGHTGVLVPGDPG